MAHLRLTEEQFAELGGTVAGTGGRVPGAVRSVAVGHLTRLRAVPPGIARAGRGGRRVTSDVRKLPTGFGAGTGATTVLGPSLRQATVPAHLMGRVAATSRMLAMCAAPFGAFLGGSAGHHLRRTHPALRRRRSPPHHDRRHVDHDQQAPGRAAPRAAAPADEPDHPKSLNPCRKSGGDRRRTSRDPQGLLLVAEGSGPDDMVVVLPAGHPQAGRGPARIRTPSASSPARFPIRTPA